MLVVKIITIILGLAFLLFGYFICFQKKYNLINGFSEDYKTGRTDEKYAKRVGLIELMLGIVLLTIGVILIVFV